MEHTNMNCHPYSPPHSTVIKIDLENVALKLIKARKTNKR
jgi:hypothetical protein